MDSTDRNKVDGPAKPILDYQPVTRIGLVQAIRGQLRMRKWLLVLFLTVGFGATALDLLLGPHPGHATKSAATQSFSTTSR